MIGDVNTDTPSDWRVFFFSDIGVLYVHYEAFVCCVTIWREKNATREIRSTKKKKKTTRIKNDRIPEMGTNDASRKNTYYKNVLTESSRWLAAAQTKGHEEDKHTYRDATKKKKRKTQNEK